MSIYTAPIIKAASQLSDTQVIEAIIKIENIFAERLGNQLASSEAADHRLVRAALYELIEARYPWLDEILNAWAEAENDGRTYTEVIIEALSAENVLV